MPSAIPKGLVSREMMTMIDGVVPRVTLCYQRQAWVRGPPPEITRFYFPIPSYRNSFIDPKRSYLRFDFKLNSAASRVFRSTPSRRSVA